MDNTTLDYTTLKTGVVDPTLGKTIKEIIMVSNRFIVYMDENQNIQFSFNGFDGSLDDFGKIQIQVSYWENMCNELFSKKEAYKFKNLLAEGYARILHEGNNKSAQNIIDLTKKRIQTFGREALRIDYSISALYSTILVIIALILLVLSKQTILSFVGSDVYNIILTGMFGGVGAFVSAMIRMRNYRAELLHGKKIHKLDGRLRIIYGVIAGSLIAVGIKSNIILGVFNNEGANIFVMTFLGAMSGASEVFLPNIIKQVEDQVSTKALDNKVVTHEGEN